VRFGHQFDIPVLAVGDRKSQVCEWPAGSEFLSLGRQRGMDFRLVELLPVDHYSRKNIGYLEAMARGATLVFDTDDDNAPLPHWRPRGVQAEVRQLRYNGWVNVYRYFSSRFIWPRGLPLENLQECQRTKMDAGSIGVVECPIQQGLVNGSPDVDAVWRLTFDEEFSFNEAPSVWLAPGSWCPFNSQSTWWFRKSFPLLYLPSFVSFRVTDIWRSFVAQRCLWELGYGIAFHGPESFQDRNAHNLLRDFEEEIPAYLNNNRIISILEGVQLSSAADTIGDNLHRCYEALASVGIMPAREMPLVEAWLVDLDACRHRNGLQRNAPYEASSH
jgi:STELLO glycosyltransferases